MAHLEVVAPVLREPKTHVRFGPFDLRTDTRELSRLGIRINLQIKPAQILEMLVTRPGEVVTREEICARLWPGGPSVDPVSGLNTAMARLRAALNDVAEKPLYIETIPRLGYRLSRPFGTYAQILRQTMHQIARTNLNPSYSRVRI